MLIYNSLTKKTLINTDFFADFVNEKKLSLRICFMFYHLEIQQLPQTLFLMSTLTNSILCVV